MLSFLADWDIDYSNEFINWFYSPNFIGGVAKYAVCILIGIILAYFICTIEGERMGINKDKVLSCATVIVPLCILGARAWYLLNDDYNSFAYYMELEGSFFKALIYDLGMFIGFRPEFGWTYEGLAGLAIHGGIAVAIVGTFFASRICKWNFFSLIDMVAPGLLIGQICGRWGNFFNQEAHGIVVGGWNESEAVNGVVTLTPKIDDLQAQYDILTKKWLVPKFIANNMRISASEKYYYGIVDGIKTFGEISGNSSTYFFYPTFYFESVLNLVGLILYFILRRQKWVKSGAFGALYLIWYGVVRFFIEIIRTDSLYIPGTPIKGAQITSLIMIAIGILVLVYLRFIKKGPNYVEVIEKNKKEVKGAK